MHVWLVLTTIACSAVESGKSKGVDSSPNKCDKLEGKAVKGVNAKQMTATQKILMWTLSVTDILGMVTLSMYMSSKTLRQHQNIGKLNP